MQNRNIVAMALGVVAGVWCAATPVRAVDLTNGDWKFSVDGNINVHYILSSCQSASSAQAVTGGLACVGSASTSSVSNIGNGLLPAALTFAVATTQAGIDLSAHFGLYPGIATNDGGSPNLQGTPGNSNTALGTTGLDVRQVYMSFGNKDMGTFTLGRNFGLFGFDAIVNDMTLPGVGVAGSASGANPANTTLGSIGLGYIYTDTLAQMNYTTPDFGGLSFTIGIYDPLNSLTDPGASQPKGSPGYHGKVAWSNSWAEGSKLSLSATFIGQKHAFVTGGNNYSYNSTGFDVFGKLDLGGLSLMGAYYNGKGMGTTGLFVFAADTSGNTRNSDGYLAQATYKFGEVKLGVNYGVSNLDLANSQDAPTLVKTNSKVTGGIYYSLTKNLTLLGEISSVEAKAHNGNDNKSNNFNVGAFLAF